MDGLFRNFVPSLLGVTAAPLALRAQPVPRWMQDRVGQRKGEEIAIRSQAWQGPRVRHMRLAYLHSPSVFEAFNLLIVPTLESEAPIFGTELLAFGGRAHLAVIDFQNLRGDDLDWQRRWIDPLRPVASRFANITTPRDDMPAWTEAFFSRYCFHLKPVGDRLAVCQQAFDAYLALFTRLLVEATTTDDPRRLEDMAQAHRTYHDDHLENEPAVRTLGSLFGTEWADRYARAFLFDGGSATRSAGAASA